MKLTLSLAIVLMSLTSIAQNKKEILCSDGSNMGGSARTYLNLDSSGFFVPGSNYFRISYASWSFQFSSARMICQTGLISINDKESFNCAGYLMGGPGLIEVSFELHKGEGKARVRNLSENNVYKDQTEGMVLNCKLN